MQVIDAMFPRVFVFRALIVSELQEVLDLTLGTATHPLPPPAHHAKLLKQLTLAAVRAWNAGYGSVYKTVQLAFDHLSRVHRVGCHASKL